MGEDKYVQKCVYVEKRKEKGERELKKPFWNPEIYEVASVRGACEGV